jgi:hypothetical protein
MEESGPAPEQPAAVAAAPAAGTDDVLGDATFDDPVPDPSTDDATPIAPDAGDVAATEAFAATDDLVPAPTLDEPSFAGASFDQPEPEFESFTEPAPQEFADSGAADFADMG